MPTVGTASGEASGAVVAGLEDPAVGELGTFDSGDGDELVPPAVGES
jgi:hypothetical protein